MRLDHLLSMEYRVQHEALKTLVSVCEVCEILFNFQVPAKELGNKGGKQEILALKIPAGV